MTGVYKDVLGKWYFWQEGAGWEGPFDTEEQARAQLEAFAHYLEDTREDEYAT